jgi:glycerol-3-phosphate dehydrogenase
LKRDPGRLRSERFDLLIIGGGINGCGILRDAALRGFRAALVEKGDFASGTSSKSSKLIHGGLRYLEQMQFGLVHEACRERWILLKIAPHLVRPLPFLIPIYRGDARGRMTIHAGMMLYDLMALFRNTKRHRMLSTEDVYGLEPDLARSGLTGGALYYDCRMDDVRLCLENVFSAGEAGATAANYAEAVSVIKRDGRITGAVVRDRLTGETFEVLSRKVINATGPWTDGVTRMDAPDASARLRPTKGVHVVVPQLTGEHALLISARRDGRVFFVIPQQGYSLIGTTDTFYDGDPDAVDVQPEDIRYLLEEAGRVLPESGLGAEHVVASFAGLRPLLTAPGEESKLSREHAIYESPSGLLTVAGGKYTTYRQIAEEVVDRIAKGAALSSRVPCTTASTPLFGGHVGNVEVFEAEASRSAAAEFGLGPDIMVNLLQSYGTRYREVLALLYDDDAGRERIAPGRPEIVAQIRYGVQQEMARTLSDFLRRRTHLALSEANGADTARRVAAVLGRYLRWDDEQTDQQVRDYLDEMNLPAHAGAPSR